MNTYSQKPGPSFAKALSGGVFTGLIVALANMLYDYIVRKSTDYGSFDIINFYTLIVFSVLSLMIAGIIYYVLTRYIPRGLQTFIVLFIALTVLAFFLPLGAGIPTSMTAIHDVTLLTNGIAIITGLAAAFLLPYLVRHSGVWW